MTTITESQGVTRPLASTGLFASVASYIASYRRNRRTFQDLAAMEDYILSDIGLSRSDIVQASMAELAVDRMAMLDVARARRMGR